MRLNELVEKAHDQAVKSGWWDIEKSPLDCHMMIVTEVAEAVEECRLPKPGFYFNDNSLKPEGEAVELADAVIRIADYFGHKGWDLEEIIKAKMYFNSTRPYRHGDKRY